MNNEEILIGEENRNFWIQKGMDTKKRKGYELGHIRRKGIRTTVLEGVVEWERRKVRKRIQLVEYVKREGR